MKYQYQKIGNKTFQYDREKAIVRYVFKATPDMYEDDANWMKKHGRPLYGIDEDGYVLLDSAGLSVENWKNKESRIEYLTLWCHDIDYETSSLVDS